MPIALSERSGKVNTTRGTPPRSGYETRWWARSGYETRWRGWRTVHCFLTLSLLYYSTECLAFYTDL
ncbi:MAG: hypothetical protein LBJ35_01875, partial [Spirochaetaceae bacterium]|nr:hypothetical protein [Spirochaetaceae bacterium]